MNQGLTLDDVRLVPANWSTILSRKDVNTEQRVTNQVDGVLQLPIIASNMDSVYSPALAQEILKFGGQSIVHRFCDIDKNITLLKEGILVTDNKVQCYPWVSIGVGYNELERTQALFNAGANVFLIDVANAASDIVLKQYNNVREIIGDNADVFVASFGTKSQINSFCDKTKILPSGVLIGQGIGSACITSIVTGVGTPSYTCIQECSDNTYRIPVILNGGISNSGQFAKALAAGCTAVVAGRIFAACEESGAPFIDSNNKVYRGSAAFSSYETQGKVAHWRSPEGEEYSIKVTGTVQDLMQQLSGGLRSSMSYCNAQNLQEFRANAKFINVSNSAVVEATAYGRK